MPDYLLPCPCGERTTVSTAQAGETIRCACGAELQVPTMRGLRELEPVVSGTAQRVPGANWDDRNRVAFLLVIGALTCVAVAVYLWASLPVSPVQPSEDQFRVAVDSATPDQLFMIHRDLLLGSLGSRINPETALKVHQMMSWGIGIVLALGVAALGCAAMVQFNRPKARR